MVFRVPTKKFEDYRYLFNEEKFPRTRIDSAFRFKSAKLLLDEEENPTMTILHFPYHAFVAGDPKQSKLAEMFNTIPEETEININEDKWLPKLQEYFRGRLIQKTRYKMAHKSLSLEKLENLKKPLPEGYSLKKTDRETIERLPNILKVHIKPFFGTVDNFTEKGIGFCVKHGGEPISMASSCLPYTDKLEVQIATVDSPEYRRKGFGTAACVALLEYCLRNKIEPHWNAFNERSVLMAEKLGYTDAEQYYVYKWRKGGEVRILKT